MRSTAGGHHGDMGCVPQTLPYRSQRHGQRGRGCRRSAVGTVDTTARGPRSGVVHYWGWLSRISRWWWPETDGGGCRVLDGIKPFGLPSHFATYLGCGLVQAHGMEQEGQGIFGSISRMMIAISNSGRADLVPGQVVDG